MNPFPDPHAATSLRQAAEARLKAKPRPRQALSERELHELQDELELRQIELEIQNEELPDLARKIKAVREPNIKRGAESTPE